MLQKILNHRKELLAVLIASIAGVFVFDYFSVHRFGPALSYKMEVAGCRGTAIAHLREPVADVVFDGNNGYAWEIKPVRLDKREALVELRIKHLSQPVGLDAARNQLKYVQTLFLALRPGQPVIIPIEGGAPAILSGSVL
jgi:hypothetical protein